MATRSPGVDAPHRATEYHDCDFPITDVEAEGRAFVERILAEGWCREDGGGDDRVGGGDATTPAGEAGYAAWNAFHYRHDGKFFHPRSYLRHAFPGVFGGTPSGSASASPSEEGAGGCAPCAATTAVMAEGGGTTSMRVLEIGCGNGSNVAPLLATDPHLRLTATDLVPAALRTVERQAHPAVTLALWDVVTGAPPTPAASWLAACDASPAGRGSMAAAVSTWLDHGRAIQSGVESGHPGYDAALCMFVLSAIHPRHHAAAWRNVFQVLRPGGHLCFRDYGRYDAAMLRAHRDNIISPRLHVRGDNTLAYYFDLEEVVASMTAAGFSVQDARYCTVMARNRRTGVEMRRVWVHAHAIKGAAHAP